MPRKTDMPPYPVLWLRSFAFWSLFLVSVLVFAVLLLFTFPLPHRARWGLLQVWVKLTLWWLKVTCKLSHEIQGLENLPDKPAVVLAKHQSTWETIALQQFIPMQVWVAKSELMWIPFFGWGLWLMKCIAIKRGTGRAAVEQLVNKGSARLKEGLWVVMFPEGTRVPPGKRGRYRIGGAVLGERSGFPVVPVAHNAGEYWPRRSFIKAPGVIQVRIGPPIVSDGKSAQEILEETSSWIEARMDEITTLK